MNLAVEDQVVRVPFDALSLGEDEGWNNPREKTGLDSASLERLGASIEKHGLFYPLLIWRPRPGSKWVVVDGQRRYLAIKLVKIKKPSGDAWMLSVPCKEVAAVSFEDATIKALVTAFQRADLSSFEKAQKCAELSHRFERSNRFIAQTLSQPEAWVSKMLKVWNAAGEKLMSAWQNSFLTDEQVQLLSKLVGEEQDQAVVAVLEARKSGKSAATEKAKALAKNSKDLAKNTKEKFFTIKLTADEVLHFFEMTAAARDEMIFNKVSEHKEAAEQVVADRKKLLRQVGQLPDRGEARS